MKQPANRFENFSLVPHPGSQTAIPAKAQRVGRQSYALRRFAFRKSYATRVPRKTSSLFVIREREVPLNCAKCTTQNAESAPSLDFYINSPVSIMRVHIHVTRISELHIHVKFYWRRNVIENFNLRTKLPLSFRNNNDKVKSCIKKEKKSRFFTKIFHAIINDAKIFRELLNKLLNNEKMLMFNGKITWKNDFSWV